MSTPHNLNYDSNIYLAVTLSPSAHLLQNPELLAVHPSLTHIGPVGHLKDVQLLSVPQGSWSRVQSDVLSALNSMEGVKRVDVQDAPRLRVKRGDEF